MKDDAAELTQLFLAEAEQQLATLEQTLLVLERCPSDVSALATAFRAVHTVKGSASMLELHGVAELAHDVEDVLERMRSGQAAMDSAVVTLLLEAVDALRSMALRVGSNEEADVRPYEGLRRSIIQAAIAARPAVSQEHRRDVEPERATRPASMGRSSATTVHVDVEKLERLAEAIGEVMGARGAFERHLARALPPDQLDLLAQFVDAHALFERVKDAVMDMRLVALAPRFRRFERAVRDAARAMGKEARLLVEESAVELDVAIVERLVEPLTHLVRNAVDHGIEPPETRASSGKARTGTVTLRASRDGSTVVVEVIDDGSGISRRAIEARASAWGIEQPTELSDRELWELVFLPGFTTAERVSELSGRGVGMDSVRTAVEAMRGSIEILSQQGQGTTVAIRVPLTLATIAALEVEAGGATYAVPLDSVVEVASASGALDGGDLPVVRWSDEMIPVVALQSLAGPASGPSRAERLVVVRHGRHPVGLLVDSVVGEIEAVMRPLPPYWRGAPWIGGSIVLQDGAIGLVLDVPALLREMQRRMSGLAVAGQSVQ